MKKKVVYNRHGYERGSIISIIMLIVDMAVVIWLWNLLAPTYFYFLPEIYLNIPFLKGVGLITLFSGIYDLRE
jgi:hypothetical protein